MSRRQRLLNGWLRRIEKPRLRTAAPATLRRSLEIQARLFFFAPGGTRRIWRRWGGVRCLELTPRGQQPNRTVFYIHGGGFVFGSPDTHRAMAAQIGQRLGARVVMPQYRLAPEAPFPAAPEDVRAAWDALIADGIDPASVVVGGDSAGGALAFGLIAALCAEGRPRPGAVFAFSPLTDLTASGDSLRSNAEAEVMLPAERTAELAETFLCGADPQEPRVSPLFGRFDGAPPSWITVGDTEILCDDARRLADVLRRDGVCVELCEEADLPHVWPLFHNILPEARVTLDRLAAWIRQQQGWGREN
ncbi:alpha/beta hydrolase [Sulfitobacter sp. HNIBRBA3233]|uniref:alpha/beta hydrolase n=1 Tax=Sulfitobacter marinivivus TaxID=3158558 RepID=UPI0032DE35E4